MQTWTQSYPCAYMRTSEAKGALKRVEPVCERSCIIITRVARKRGKKKYIHNIPKGIHREKERERDSLKGAEHLRSL